MRDVAGIVVCISALCLAAFIVVCVMEAIENYPKAAIPTLLAFLVIGGAWGVWYLTTHPEPPKPTQAQTLNVQPEAP